MAESVVDLVRSPALRRPDAVALDGDGRRLTYGELWHRSDLVAAALLRAGLRPGDRVAYLDRNGSEYWELVLGALKCGLVVCPLNFRLGPDELDWILADAGAALVIAGADYAGALPAGVRTVTVGPEYEHWLAADSSAATDPGLDVRGAEPVMLMYSSGTTGRPKGVRVDAGQLVWTVHAFGACFGVDADSVSLVPTPYHHIAGAGWSLVTLSVGGRVVQSREPTPASMLDQLIRYRATHAAMVPALIQAIVDDPAAQRADFSALRHVVYGASPISEALLSRAVALLGADFNQSYGLTESTGVGTLLAPDDHRPTARTVHRLRSAGRPLPGMEVAVVDAVTGEPVPAGEVGEVVLRGPAVTPGYWHRPDDTAAALLPGGWLRTGDAGSLDTDGYLYLRDRIKDMIVSGGENVYPAEVENLLAGHPEVAEVAVIGVPSPRWGETPVALVVPVPGADPDGGALIAWARERIAHYKCPTEVVLVGELPRNASGKVLKRVLREPYWRGHDRAVG